MAPNSYRYCSLTTRGPIIRKPMSDHGEGYTIFLGEEIRELRPAGFDRGTITQSLVSWDFSMRTSFPSPRRSHESPVEMPCGRRGHLSSPTMEVFALQRKISSLTKRSRRSCINDISIGPPTRGNRQQARALVGCGRHPFFGRKDHPEAHLHQDDHGN